MKSIEIILKIFLLKLLLFFRPVRKKSALPDFNSQSNILFIRLNRIGDAIITTPLIRAIKEKCQCKIHVLADVKNHFIYERNPNIEKVHIYKKGLAGFIELNRIIRKNKIDAIIDLHDDISTTVSFLVAFADIKYKLALEKSNSAIYSHTVERLDSSQYHIVDRILNLKNLFASKEDNSEYRLEFYPLDKENQTAQEYFKKINPDKKLLLGINISAGSKARFWGVDNFRMLCKLLSGYNLTTVLFSTDNDLNLAKQIIDENNIYPITKCFGIFAAGIMQLDFLITPDTSAVHIASVKQIPVFGLYVNYNTSDVIWSPYKTDFEYAVTTEPTLKNITFEEVKQKLIPFLEKYLNGKQNSEL
ncbi:MAG: hypothetical protein CO128_04060 [Ignavibacteriales bacterium CG_4_9_14_3_um_filter_30_11]|nr:MAG: hypothetical protein CO128_04060 [Ignavibacteriales bacterium CG_4_9_14_3_um_filter_30_11]